MKIVDIPLESLSSRYTVEWRNWFSKYMEPAFRLDGEMLTKEVGDGAFLDVCGTNYFKASQLKKICAFIHERRKEPNKMEDYIFFFHDLWWPGLEALAYMRNGLDLKFKIAGCLHAGTYDRHDFVTMKGMGYWGEAIENGWFRLIDHIFIATEFHKRVLIHSRDVNPNKVHVTGFPIYYDRKPEILPDKENIIVFPNRLTKDKNPQLYDFAEKYLFPKNYQCVRTFKEDGTFMTKDEYWDTLHRAKIMISFADHENWGISVQEALFAGCFVLVPNKLSYVELYSPCFRYSDHHSFETALDIILGVVSYAKVSDSAGIWFSLREQDMEYALKRGREAIPNMLQIMGA